MNKIFQFTEKDIKSIQKKGMSLEQAYKQIQWIRDGSNYVVLDRPCRVNDGIDVIDSVEFGAYFTYFEEAMKQGRVLKFVPASGAASRMFSVLLKYMEFADQVSVYKLLPNEHFSQKEIDELRSFFSQLKQFAFYDDLKNIISAKQQDINDLLDSEHFYQIIEYLLTDKGLNYVELPKGLIPFHHYENGARTAFEEHLIESSVLCVREDGQVFSHFTINDQYKDQIRKTLEEHADHLTSEWSKYNIAYSYQKDSTDTLALDMDDQPFYDASGELLFRPGGHGSLLENLNDLKADIVFVKNIDNIVPDRLKNDTFIYKRLIAGFLISLQEKMFEYLRKLESADVSDGDLKSIIEFCCTELKLDLRKDVESLTIDAKNEYLFDQLNRPIRVCGMVKNVGEPGGGPFWVKGNDGMSKQIVETSQVDLKNEEQITIMSKATHFNPVDLVCGLKDYNGASFNLHAFVDPSTRFVAQKTYDGRALKALEWPGLWNGAMAHWITLFVEVPLSTFNPVKTVNDLLRQEHL